MEVFQTYAIETMDEKSVIQQFKMTLTTLFLVTIEVRLL